MTDTSEVEHQSKVMRCWGKTERNSTDPTIFHPALFHMVDVGFVAQVLLNGKTSARWKNVFSNIYNIDPALLISFLPFIVSLHDIGKISSSFQRMNEPQHIRLTGEGFTFGRSKDLLHPEVGRNFIHSEWPEQSGIVVSERSKEMIREMIGGHHGSFAQPGSLFDTRLKLKIEEPPEWKALRIRTFEMLEDVFWDRSINEIPEPQNMSAAVMELTGFTTLCDWIGSDQRYFTPQSDLLLGEYIKRSLERACQAVEQDGFIFETLSDIPSDFNSLFGEILSPRPLQLAVNDIPDEVMAIPTLVVIEAPTGEGKTEAALALAHKIARARKTDEFYYALPTTATSNQMFLRVQKYLHENLGLGTGAKLIHGQAFLTQDSIANVPLSNGEQSQTDQTCMDWFNSKKRSLLAPFGVGTIDQIELGALNVRHASLRLSGLAGKVVILDEVHAYDTYMTTIVVRLLTWLKELSVSVILLSATLPASRRTQLMQVYTSEVFGVDEPNSYPSILIANSNNILRMTPKASQLNREIGLKFLSFSEDDAEEKAKWLVDQVSGGGCACWITNTVNRAQEIYSHVMAFAPQSVQKVLFHARFPLDQRQEIEENIVNLVGPDKSNRPTSAIVIGTQVLEQSLDLDFDVMVSDLAPVDLLLQRAGRLHRHSQTSRPKRLMSPEFYINQPFDQEKNLDLKKDKWVYAEYFLRRTYDVLKDRNNIHLPEDFRILVEQVYDEIPLHMSQELQTAHDNLIKEEESARQEAELRLTPKPDAEELFTGSAAHLTFTENETDASWIVAQTRLGEQSLNLIPLENMGDCFSFPGCEKPLEKCLTASREMEMQMLRRQIRISHREVVKALREQKFELPKVFSSSSILKDYLPLWLIDGASEIQTAQGSYIMRLDLNLGLLIEKKKGG